MPAAAAAALQVWAYLQYFNDVLGKVTCTAQFALQHQYRGCSL
jgi:hypothetical protein